MALGYSFVQALRLPFGIRGQLRHLRRCEGRRPPKMSSFHGTNVVVLPDLHRLELVFRYLPDQSIKPGR